MRTIGEVRTARVLRKPLVTLAIFLLVIVAGYKTAGFILADDLTTLELIGLVFAGGAVIVAILNDWRRGLYALVGWIVFEDFVRKYLGNNMGIYFGKDVLVLVLYLSFFRSITAQGRRRFKIPFRVALLLFVWTCLVQVFNPLSPSIFYGILGIKVNLLYIPLIYIGYELIESEEELRRFFSFVCVLILVVAGLGLAQSVIGPTFLNPSRLQEDIRELSTMYRSSPITGLVAYRPTSVFVSSGRFQDFLVVSWIISLGFGGYLLLRRRRGRTLVFTTVGVVAAASLMSASRGVFLWNAGTGLIVAAGFLWGAPWREREVIRVLRAIQRTALMVGCGVVILLTAFPQELGSRIAIYSETLLPDSPASELVRRTQTYPLKQLEYAFSTPNWPYGYGFGTCTLGSQYLMRILHVPPVVGIGVESGFGNLLLELGLVGLLLWIVMGVGIVSCAGKVVVELRGTPWFPLGFTVLLYATLLFFPMMFTGGSSYQDFVLNSSLWLYLGILFRLREFPKAVQLTQTQTESRQA